MSQSFRIPQILALARKHGQVTVEGLAAHFGVTLQTIRRDLSDLAQSGRLERVHGGAVLPSGTHNIGYEERRRLNADGKARIARQIAALIPDNASVFLSIGTTIEAVARECLRHRGLMVVTNNMNVVQILSGNPECEVLVTGGSLRRADGGLVGRLTTDTIRQFRFDTVVIGCSALEEDGDLLDFDVQEVAVTQAVMAQGRRILLGADHTKFQRSAPARITDLARVDVFVTDRPLPAQLVTACRDWTTEVVVADANAPAAAVGPERKRRPQTV